MTQIDRIAEPWGTRTPYGAGERWPERVDTFLADGLGAHDVDRWVQSASILHSDGDALDIAVKDERTGLRRMAAGVSLDWEVIAQTAQAMKDRELLAIAEDWHHRRLRQLRWANAKVKESAAQIMVTG